MHPSDEIGMTVVGALVAVLGVIGLIFAAKATDGGVSIFGLLLFGFAVLFEFWLLKRYYDGKDAA